MLAFFFVISVATLGTLEGLHLHGGCPVLLFGFLVFLLFLLTASPQQGEDNAGLRIHPHGSHYHPSRALHHVGP